MKKFFITAAVATLFSASVFADGSKKTATKIDVSYTVVNEFNADFAGAKNVTWTVSKDFQKANFILNGVKTTAFYNHEGEFVAVTMNVDAKAIPAKAKAEIADKYNGYDVAGVIVVQNNTELNPEADETAYFVDLKNESKEILVKITPSLHTEFYTEVK
ncbi:MAG: hypothetical protein JSU01_22290 [Bacteroidetes bacterium]|nr:hypothetical protein [Bacteroidota bacterium]